MSPLDLRTAFEGTNGSERQLRAIVDIIPPQIWFGRPDGTAEFLSQRWLDYTRLSADDARGWGWTAAIHPDDRPGLVCTNTPAGEVEQVNQTFLRYTGKPLEELRNWPSVVHPDDLPQVAERWTNSVAAGDPFDTDVRVRNGEGVYRWFHCRGLPSYDTNGGIVRWYNLLTDIEDRKRAEDALRASEHNLRSIIDTIHPDDRELVREVWRRPPCAGEAAPQ